MTGLDTAAAARTDTRNHTCQEVTATVKYYEVIVLTTGPNTYDRFVAFPNYCQNAFKAARAYAPTLDNPRCFIGYRCVQRIFD